MLTTPSNSYKNFATPDEARYGLKKYGYFDNTPFAEHYRYLLIQLLDNCDNDDLVQFYWWFFMKTIHIYFFENRAAFNRIRACFTRYLLADLILRPIGSGGLATEIKDNYKTWFDKCKLNQCPICSKLGKRLWFMQENNVEQSS